MSATNRYKAKREKTRGTVIRCKLGDIKQKAKHLKNDRVKHLKRFWTTQDHDDAIEYIGRDTPKTAIFPHWWHKRNKRRWKVRQKRKAENFGNVLQSLMEYGYQPELFKNGHMKLHKFHWLIDGNHRYELLYAKHGPDYEADFLVVGWVQSTMVTIITLVMVTTYMILFLILVLIRVVSIPYNILNKLFNFLIRKVSKE